MDSNITKYFQTYIQTNEGGFHNKVYPDTKGIATIGYGTNLTTDFAKSYITNTLKYDYQKVLSGKQIITIDDANSLFQSSYDIAFKDASKFVSNFDSLIPERQLILVDMSYNLGSKLKNFVNLKSAIEQGDWERASKEILDSKYASDVKSRADRNAEVMKNGISEATDKYLEEHKVNINSLSDTVKQNNNDQANNDAEYMQDQDGKDIPDIKEGSLVVDSGQIKTDVNYDQDSQTLFYEDENGYIQQISYEDNSDLLIYGDTSNPDKITFTDENGDYQVWEKDNEGNFVQTNKVDYSGVLNTAINQIGSLIIMNNQDFSNIEKIAVSTTVSTIADFATFKGTEFNTTIKER